MTTQTHTAPVRIPYHLLDDEDDRLNLEYVAEEAAEYLADGMPIAEVWACVAPMTTAQIAEVLILLADAGFSVLS